MDSVNPLDRMTAIMLAKSIANRKEVLQLTGEMRVYVARLANYRMFTIGEMSRICGVSEYTIKQYVDPDDVFRGRSGIHPGHLDHLLRMVDSKEFAKLHTQALVRDGATVSALARITGLSETSLRRWAKEKEGE